MLIADHGNHRIQVFDSAGNFLFKFGSEGTGDGQFKYPHKLLIHNNALYVVDYGNHRIQVFQLSQEFDNKDYNIPNWIKNNAKWWADGQISDNDFVKGIEFLIKIGIIRIS